MVGNCHTVRSAKLNMAHCKDNFSSSYINLFYLQHQQGKIAEPPSVTNYISHLGTTEVTTCSSVMSQLCSFQAIKTITISIQHGRAEVIFSYNHIMLRGWKGFEISFSPNLAPAIGRDTCHYTWLLYPTLNTFRVGASTASQGNIFKCLIILTAENFCLVSNPNLPFFNVYTLPFVLSLQFLMKSPFSGFPVGIIGILDTMRCFGVKVPQGLAEQRCGHQGRWSGYMRSLYG